jgi:hypothetical protein
MMHFLFAYALAGISLALVIATTDLVIRRPPQMGIVYTLICGVLWPAFAVIAAVVTLRLALLRKR